MAAKSPPSLLRRWWFWAGLVLILGAIGIGLWVKGKPPPNMVTVLELNSRGVGHMERFEFADALADFEDVAQLAPDWLPGRINLAIALMTLGRGDDLGGRKEEINVRAQTLFKDILKTDP